MQVVLVNQPEHLSLIIRIRAIAFRDCVRTCPDADSVYHLLSVRHSGDACVLEALVIPNVK